MTKKLIFSSVLLLFVVAMVEALSFIAYTLKFGQYSHYQLQMAKIDAIEEPDRSVVFVPEAVRDEALDVRPILHPFIGYTVDGKRRSPDCPDPANRSCYKRIKVNTDSPLARRGPDDLVVGITGGSFADGTVRGSTPKIFNRLLSAIPQFSGKNITVYNLAGGGYKQPQQLMHVNYYYSLGAEFDLIINIDGFNELAATFYGWRDSELHPSFPVSWNNRVSSGINQSHLNLLADKRANQIRHASRSRFMRLPVLRHSPTMNLLWRLMDNRSRFRVAQIDAQLIAAADAEQLHRDFRYEALGPDYDLPSHEALTEYAVDLWANSSRAMHALAVGKGAQYFHFIQPNQYIEGAKILSDYELENTVLASGGYGNVYRMGYPLLAAKADELKAEGIAITNLTNLFSDTADTLYIDNCCHLNPKGYFLVAQAVAADIERRLQLQ